MNFDSFATPRGRNTNEKRPICVWKNWQKTPKPASQGESDEAWNRGGTAAPERCVTEVYAAGVALPKSGAAIDSLLESVPPWRREAALRHRDPDDQARSLCAFLLAQYAVRDCTGAVLEARPGPFGKPVSVGPGIYFSLSHSGGMVACAVSSRPVGVDVERIRPVRLDLARRFFALAEYEELLQRPGEERLAGFFEMWTYKESYLKAIGTGLRRPLSSFRVSRGEDGFAEVYDGGGQALRLRSFPLLQGYALSVACEGWAEATLVEEATFLP